MKALKFEKHFPIWLVGFIKLDTDWTSQVEEEHQVEDFLAEAVLGCLIH